MMKVDVVKKSNQLVQDSWSVKMLCSKWEHHFNQLFEDITLKELRKSREKYSDSVLLKFKTKNPQRIASFMLSLLWRAAQSSHWAYDKIKLPEVAIEGFGEYLLTCSKPEVLWRLSYRITALFDSKGLFDADELSRVIASPCLGKLSGDTFSYVFMFEGYKFEVIASSSKLNIDQVGVIKPSKRIYNLARQCIWSDPTFGKTYREMYELAQSNRVKDGNDT